MAGCGGGKTTERSKPEPKKPTADEPARTLRAQAGSATHYTVGTPRQRLWTVYWQRGTMTMAGKREVTGAFEDVRGTLFRQDKEVGDFVADRATMDQKANLLILEGNVKVTSRDPDGSMECQRLEWRAELEQLRASGSVVMVTAGYRVGPFVEFWATPDFSRAGTPEGFEW